MSEASKSALFDRIEALLEIERRALVSLDASEIDRVTQEKQALFQELATAGGWSPREHAPRLERVIASVRRNLILLSCARDCLKGALAAAGVDPRTSQTFSVTG